MSLLRDVRRCVDVSKKPAAACTQAGWGRASPGWAHRLRGCEAAVSIAKGGNIRTTTLKAFGEDNYRMIIGSVG